MNYTENIILHCLKQLNGERTIYSIYHLLNGKKSSQTIQDAHLYSLKNYFRILETLKRETFDEIFEHILKKGWLEECGEQRYLLSPDGLTYLKEQTLPLYINGWMYHRITPIAWERLSLLIQVASNFTYKESSYVPIQKNREVHNWLKVFLRETNIPREVLGKLLFEEIIDCIENVEGIDPNVLVFRFTGYRQIGLTSSQIANKFKMDSLQYELEFLNILHYIFHVIESEENRFRVLRYLFLNIKEKEALTLSSRKTWNLLNQGLSLEQIAGVRDFKISTIEDHLVEFALNISDFSIDKYVDPKEQKMILEISKKSATRQLKVIRNSLKTVSYFQIRLVLAKYGDRS